MTQSVNKCKMLHNIPDEKLNTLLKVSAPGKIIFVGEHSVVYGKSAIAFSLGLRTELVFKPAKDSVALHLPEIQVDESWSLTVLKRLWEKLKKNPRFGTNVREPEAMTEEEGKILRDFLGVVEVGKRELGLMAFFHLYTTILPYPVPFSISVKSEMPVGAGLGSSAAYAVCLATILQWLAGNISPTDFNKKIGKSETLKLVCQWSLCCEKILHGTPSGIDNAICTYGEAVSFRDGKIELIQPPHLRVMLINTRVSRNTKSLVAKTKEKYNKHSAVIEPIFESMDAIAESVLKALRDMKANNLTDQMVKRKLIDIGELLDINHSLLNGLGVSHPSLERIVSVAKNYNLNAKLTGAGGGGFGFILLLPDTPQQVINSCKKELELGEFDVWITSLGSEGMKMTTQSSPAKVLHS